MISSTIAATFLQSHIANKESIFTDIDSTLLTKPIFCVALLVVSLLALLYFELERVHPTSKDLGSDVARPLPFIIKIIDIFLDGLPWVVFDIYNPASLLAKGAKDAGLSESGYSADVIEALEVLCCSLNDDGVKMHWVGRFNMHSFIVSGLSQYLQIHEAHRLNPELSKQKLNDPMIVVGLPRTGTTHLHRLLELAPDGASLPMWELFRPVPPTTGFDFRRLVMKVEIFFWKYFANRFGMDSIHYIRPDLPDECTFSLRLGGSSLLFWWLAPVHSYYDWLCTKSNLEESYKTYRLVLQLIQARDPTKRLILKCPSHSYALKTLTKIIPEAQIVMTHRDPRETFSSQASLVARLQASSAKEPIDWRQSVNSTIHNSFISTQRMVEFASQSPAPKVYHVAYHKLINEPTSLVGDIHKFFGIKMTKSHEDTLSKFLSENKQHSHGKHNHTRKNIGIMEWEINEGLKDYLKFFAEYLPIAKKDLDVVPALEEEI